MILDLSARPINILFSSKLKNSLPLNNLTKDVLLSDHSDKTLNLEWNIDLMLQPNTLLFLGGVENPPLRSY